MERNQTVKDNRITVIDALRGFALLGVVLVHMQQHYSIFNFGAFTPTEPAFPVLDGWIGWLTRNVLMGRFINIFAFLFGMSFFIQMDRAAKKGVDFRRRFIWRMVILFLIGVVGSAFYSGDILSFYALFGLVLVLLYPLKTKVLVIIASLILIGAPRWISFSYDKIVAPRETTVVANVPETERVRAERPRQMADVAQETPSLANTIKSKSYRWPNADITLPVQLGRSWLSDFLLSLFWDSSSGVSAFSRRNICTLAVTSYCSYYLLPGHGLSSRVNGLLPHGQVSFMQSTTPSAAALFRMTLNDVNMVPLSAAITMGFVILYHMKGIGKCLNLLTPYGRMGLTNYEAQGIIGSILFSLWGFGSIFGRWHATELFCLGIAFYIVQVVFSKIWLTYFKYGPLEWFWRSATYLKWQPFRK